MKHCTHLQKNSKSVFLKDVAQTSTISLLFPDYRLTWEHPIATSHLLLLDTALNPVHLTGSKQDFTWLNDIAVVECMPRLGASWSRFLGRDVTEVKL